MLSFKVLKATGVYTILGFIPLVSSFVLLPIYTQFLHASDYGIVALGGLTEAYLMIFLTFGLPMAFSVFFFDYDKKPGGVNNLLSNSLVAILTNAAVIALILSFFGNWLFNALWDGHLSFYEFGWYIFANCVFLALNQILFQYYRIKENLSAVIIVTLIPFVFSTLGGVIGVVILKLGAYGSIVCKAIGTVLGSFPFYLYIFKRIGFNFNREVFKELYEYAYPFVIIFFLTSVSETVDKFLLNKYFDLATLGLYNFSSVIVTPVAILIQSYWNSVTPSMYKLATDNGSDKYLVLNTYFKGTLFLTLVAIWGVIMVIDPVIKIVANPSYHGATYFVPILALAVLGKAYFNIYTFNASFYKKTRLLPLINIASFLFGVATAYALLNFIGIWAILISVIVSRLIQGVAAYILEKKLGLNSFPIFTQLWIVILSVFVISVNYMFIYNNGRIENWVINFVEGLLFFCLIAIINRWQVVRIYRLVFR